MRKLIFPIILAVLISGCISPEKPETTTFEVTPTISTTSISESELLLNERCGPIVNLTEKESCIAAVAKEAKNFAMCGPLSIKDKCIYDVGVAAKDVNICGEVSDKAMKESCIAAVA